MECAAIFICTKVRDLDATLVRANDHGAISLIIKPICNWLASYPSLFPNTTDGGHGVASRVAVAFRSDRSVLQPTLKLALGGLGGLGRLSGCEDDRALPSSPSSP